MVAVRFKMLLSQYMNIAVVGGDSPYNKRH